MSHILIIQNDETDPIGWFGDRWTTAGFELTTVRAYAGDQVPTTLGGADALVILGGVMSADDDADHPWLSDIKALARATVADAVPVLGICLGHQILGSALGGRVGRNENGLMFGVYPVSLTVDGQSDALLQGLGGIPAIQYNQDVVHELPPAAVRLASAPDGSVQAARFSPTTWGVQFHPEALEDTFGVWLDSKDGGIRTEHTAALAAQVDHAHAGLASWSRLADAFADVVAQSVAARGRPTA